MELVCIGLVGDGGGLSKVGITVCCKIGLGCKTIFRLIDGVLFGLIYHNQGTLGTSAHLRYR